MTVVTLPRWRRETGNAVCQSRSCPAEVVILERYPVRFQDTETDRMVEET